VNGCSLVLFSCFAYPVGKIFSDISRTCGRDKVCRMKYVLVLLLMCLAGGCSSLVEEASLNVVSPSPTPQRPDEVVIPDMPKTTWEPIFFEAIDQATGFAGYKKLRKTQLGDGDIQVRVWAGFGLTPLKGFVLSRVNSKWSANRIGSKDSEFSFKASSFALTEPEIGWEAAWASLLNHKILTLPDARAIKCEAMYEDGYSYVVEVKKGPNYRTYMYDNPDAKFDNRCGEADEILSIAKIITDDFRVKGFRAH